MKLAKIRFVADDVCARALKGLASRMKITVLADEVSSGRMLVLIGSNPSSFYFRSSNG